ncbi:MAG: DUF411 domain-containing protein [Anaerolineae bacterium]
MKMKLIVFALLTLALAACAGSAQPDAPAQEPAQVPVASTTIHVYKSPTCGCCGNWVDRLVEYEFDVGTEDMDNLTGIKKQYGVPANLQSCHTAVVDGYVIEGHVPPADIEQLLAERPDAVGLTVPGMVVGLSGMEVPGSPVQPYDVVLFDESGQISLFASYGQAE